MLTGGTNSRIHIRMASAGSFIPGSIAEGVHSSTNAMSVGQLTQLTSVGSGMDFAAMRVTAQDPPPQTSHDIKVGLPLSPSSAIRAINSPVNIEVFSRYLPGYDTVKSHYLVRGFAQGFSIEFQGEECPMLEDNNPCLSSNLIPVIEEKILKETQAGRIQGPFSHPPFQNFRVSPIKVVPKKTAGQFRFIHNLSFPYDEGTSINSSIPRDKVAVQYCSLDDAITHIKWVGKHAWLAKTDIESAFRIIPITPADHHLLGFVWQGQYYYDTTLPMGCSMSCAIFEAFSTAIQWIAQNKLNIPRIVHVLDDFLIISDSEQEGKDQLRRFIAFCEACGIPIVSDKTEGPATTLTFLGIDLDVKQALAILPKDKVQKCSQLLQNVLSKKKITLHALQSLLGSLKFACRAIVPGRAFLRRLYSLCSKARKPFHHVTITSGARLDLNVWSTFLSRYNGRSFFIVSGDNSLKLYTDAAGGIGFGAVLGRAWTYGVWPSNIKGMEITLLELYPIVLAVNLWGEHIRNRMIEFHTDNMALVSIINSTSSSKENIMALVRTLVATMLKFNFSFRAFHIPGAQNDVADSLSRFQIGRFHTLHPEAYSMPTHIPSHLKPEVLLRT